LSLMATTMQIPVVASGNFLNANIQRKWLLHAQP
jgi:hypothetical protein